MKIRLASALALVALFAASSAPAAVPSEVKASFQGFTPPLVVAFTGDTFTVQSTDVNHTFSTDAEVCEGYFGQIQPCELVLFPGDVVQVDIHDHAAKGSFGFFCRLHPYMEGTILITQDPLQEEEDH